MPDVTLVQEDTYALEIWGGKSFTLDVQYVETEADGTETPVALDPVTDRIVGQVARFAGGPILVEFATTITDPANGWFRLELTSAQTRKVVDRADYEVVLITGSHIVGLFGGKVQYRRGVLK